MTDKAVFSPEYVSIDTTDSQPPPLSSSSALLEEEKNVLLRKIESDYELSKPRRKIIRAKIIPK